MHSIVRGKPTRIVLVLASIVILIVLGSSVVNLALNPCSFLNQNVSVSEDAYKTSPVPLLEQTTENSMAERGLNNENSTVDEQVTVQNGTLKGNDRINPPSSENPVDTRTGGLSNETVQSAIVPIPDGRIFYQGELPYGYLPTVNPKGDTSIPLIPIDFEG